MDEINLINSTLYNWYPQLNIINTIWPTGKEQLFLITFIWSYLIPTELQWVDLLNLIELICLVTWSTWCNQVLKIKNTPRGKTFPPAFFRINKISLWNQTFHFPSESCFFFFFTKKCKKQAFICHPTINCQNPYSTTTQLNLT